MLKASLVAEVYRTTKNCWSMNIYSWIQEVGRISVSIGTAGAEEDVKAMLKKLSEQVLELLGSMQHLPGMKRLMNPDVILMSTLWVRAPTASWWSGTAYAQDFFSAGRDWEAWKTLANACPMNQWANVAGACLEQHRLNTRVCQGETVWWAGRQGG